MVKFGKNLIRIWVEFDRNLILTFSDLGTGIFRCFFAVFLYLGAIKKPDILSGFC